MIILSGAPTVVREDVDIDLPDRRDQLHTRSDPQFAALRSRIYAQIQAAKREGSHDAARFTDLARQTLQ